MPARITDGYTPAQIYEPGCRFLNAPDEHKVSGITVKAQLYATDTKERYFHIYYDDGKKAAEREKLEDKIDRMGKKLKECMGENIRPLYWHEGLEDEKFLMGIEKTRIIN